MARVLTCTDPVPNADGSCTSAVYLEQPSILPALTVEEGQQIGEQIMIACVLVLALKLVFKPTNSKGPVS